MAVLECLHMSIVMLHIVMFDSNWWAWLSYIRLSCTRLGCYIRREKRGTVAIAQPAGSVCISCIVRA